MVVRIRAFLAVEASPEVRREAARLTSRLAHVAKSVKWVEAENMHLTLKFFSEIAPEAVPTITRAVQHVALQCPLFEMEVHGAGAFPKIERPRTLWAGVREGAERLVELAGAIDEALEPLGYPRESRRFHAHLTMGRVRGRQQGGILAEELRSLSDHPLGRTMVSELVFFSSELQKSGPVYTRMATIRLG